jgi:hypothetical protein
MTEMLKAKKRANQNKSHRKRAKVNETTETTPAPETDKVGHSSALSSSTSSYWNFALGGGLRCLLSLRPPVPTTKPLVSVQRRLHAPRAPSISCVLRRVARALK